MERLKAAFASVYEIAPVKRRRGTSQCAAAGFVVGGGLNGRSEGLRLTRSTRSGIPAISQRAFPHHVASQLVHRFVDREILRVAPIRRPISMFVKFDFNRRWSAPRPSTGRQPCMECNILYITLARCRGGICRKSRGRGSRSAPTMGSIDSHAVRSRRSGGESGIEVERKARIQH